MAWTEPLDSGRYRGGYRRPGNPKKLYVNGTFALKRDAREAAQEEEVKARRETARSAGKLSARTTWGEWWDLIKEGRASKPTDTDVRERKLVRRYLMPQWGEVPLNLIEQPLVQQWVNALTAGNVDGWTREGSPPSPAYVRSVYGLFAATIGQAVPRVLTTSPCTGIKLPTVRKKPKAYMPVADAEKLAFKRQDYRDAVDLVMETGIRPNELCGLHANRIDWDSSQLHVKEVFVERKGVIRPWPKDEDERLVPLTERAKTILHRRLDGRDLAEGCGVPHSDGAECRGPLVFLTDRGRVMRPKGLHNAMATAARNAKLPMRGGYTLRRGYATRAIDGGADPFTVKRIMGHADLEELEGYVQETPEARAKLLAALGEKPPLKVVEQPGTPSGTNSDGNTLEDTGTDTTGTTG